MGILFWCVLTILYHVHFSRAAWGEPFCWRLSTNGCDGFGLHTSGTNKLSTYRPPELRGGNQLAVGPLRTIEAIFVRIQGEREGGYLVLCVSIFSYHVPSSRAARGAPACRRLSTQVCGDFGSHTSGTEGWGSWSGVSTILYLVHFSRAARGKPACWRLSTNGLAILVRIQAEREGGDYVLVRFNIFIQCNFLPGCAGDTRFPTNLYSQLRRFWFAVERESRDFILLCFNIFIP